MPYFNQKEFQSLYDREGTKVEAGDLLEDVVGRLAPVDSNPWRWFVSFDTGKDPARFQIRDLNANNVAMADIERDGDKFILIDLVTRGHALYSYRLTDYEAVSYSTGEKYPVRSEFDMYDFEFYLGMRFTIWEES